MADYYVSTTGSDSNAGTGPGNSEAFLTLQKAADTVAAGDTVYVRGGTYNACKANFSTTGTSGNRITFQNYQSESPILDGTGNGQNAILYWGDGAGYNYITIDGFEIRDAVIPVWVRGSYNIITNCTVHNSTGGNDAISVLMGSGGANDGNQVTYCTVYDATWNGINFMDQEDGVISHNTVYNCDHVGINVMDADSLRTNYSGNDVHHNIVYDSNCGMYFRHQTNQEIYNNLIYDSYGTGGNGYGIFFHLYTGTPAGEKYTANSKVYNNTIAGCYEEAITTGPAGNLTIKNNIFYRNHDGGTQREIHIDSYYWDNHTIDYNLYDNQSGIAGRHGTTDKNWVDWQALGHESNGVDGTANFVDVSGDDYRIGGASDAVDAGTDLTSAGVTDDLIGISRPQGSEYDMGAYEYSVTAAKLVIVLSQIQIMPIFWALFSVWAYAAIRAVNKFL